MTEKQIEEIIDRFYIGTSFDCETVKDIVRIALNEEIEEACADICFHCHDMGYKDTLVQLRGGVFYHLYKDATGTVRTREMCKANSIRMRRKLEREQ